MSKKNKLIIAAFLLISVICVFVMFVLFKKSNKKVKASYKYDTLKNVLANQDSALNNKYDNLVLPDMIYPSNPEKLYEFYEDNSIKSDPTKTINDAVGLFTAVTGLPLDENSFVEDHNEYYLEISPENNPDMWMGAYMEQGVCDISTLDAALRRSNSGIIKGSYYIRRGDIPNDEFDVAGEMVNVKDAVDMCVKYLNDIDIYKYLDKKITLEPSIVIVKQTKGPYDYSVEPVSKQDDTNYILVFFDIIYDGVPICDTGVMNDVTKYFDDASFCLMVDEKDHIGCIRHTGDPVVRDFKELEDKFITLDSCLDVVSEYLASESNYTVTEIGIRYCTLTDKNTKQNTKRPYWRIILKEMIGDDLHARKARAAYVDMVSGDIYLFDDYLCQMLGTKEYNSKK